MYYYLICRFIHHIYRRHHSKINTLFVVCFVNAFCVLFVYLHFINIQDPIFICYSYYFFSENSCHSLFYAKINFSMCVKNQSIVNAMKILMEMPGFLFKNVSQIGLRCFSISFTNNWKVNGDAWLIFKFFFRITVDGDAWFSFNVRKYFLNLSSMETPGFSYKNNWKPKFS